jgi:micrococcal nuclease
MRLTEALVQMHSVSVVKTTVFALLLALLLGCSHPAPVAPPLASVAPTPPTSVVKVHDGDTLTVVSHGTSQRVRLAGIDCPESDQPYGAEATEVTKVLALDREVTVTPFTTDRYGRTVADVTLQDGRSLTHELVKSGACWWYRKYAPGDMVLKRLEMEARKERRGIWATESPMPPWKWRAQHRDAAKGSPQN